LKQSNSWRWIILVIVLTLLIFLALSVYVTTRYVASLSYQLSGSLVQKRYIVSGDAMRNALHDGQVVLVDTTAYRTHHPKRGDVIVFHQPDHPDRELIKRVIGLPGDTIRIDGTNVWVNNVELHELYITVPWNPDTETITVPPNDYFVMGDNRPVSNDSRYFGPVPKNSIIGQAVMVEGPQQQWQPINTYPNVFASVK
jgi:signal peptidase I